MQSVMFVGGTWSKIDAEKGGHFKDASGGLLRAYCQAVGMDFNKCHQTNVFNIYPQGNRIEFLCGNKAEGIVGMPAVKAGRYIRKEFEPELQRLYKEINHIKPNLIIALGQTACWALFKSYAIEKLRGVPALSLTGHKTIPTYHPAVVNRQQELRPIFWSDLTKCSKEQHFAEIRRPSRTFWIAPTLADMQEFEKKYFTNNTLLSVDIETYAETITCIGFAPDERIGIVVPFYSREKKNNNYWDTLQEELEAWDLVRKWMQLPIPKVGQNFNYDMAYIHGKYKMRIAGGVEDTMLMHHAQQLEMKKSLGFLASMYTDEPSWKFMRLAANKTIKKED